MEEVMERAIAREILTIFGVAAVAVALLLLARFAGITFTTQTYLWSFGVLYGLRVMVWAIKTVRSGHHASSSLRSG